MALLSVMMSDDHLFWTRTKQDEYFTEPRRYFLAENHGRRYFGPISDWWRRNARRRDGRYRTVIFCLIYSEVSDMIVDTD